MLFYLKIITAQLPTYSKTPHKIVVLKYLNKKQIRNKIQLKITNKIIPKNIPCYVSEQLELTTQKTSIMLSWTSTAILEYLPISYGTGNISRKGEYSHTITKDIGTNIIT